ncbi:DNA-invertase [Escherichia coli]|nr:DNA-invertase [Escherichia coli]
MQIGYVRVSTNDQNTALQRDALERSGCELIFEDKMSGKNSRQTRAKKVAQDVIRGRHAGCMEARQAGKKHATPCYPDRRTPAARS